MQACGPQGSAHAFVERGNRCVARACRCKREAIGEADSEATVARGVSRDCRVGWDDTDLKRCNRLNGSAQALLVFSRPDQGLGVVDGVGTA